MKPFTLPEFCELSNWAAGWLSTAANYDWGFSTRKAPARVTALNPVLIERNASCGDWAELLEHGPRFCAAVAERWDAILNSRPAQKDFSAKVGFLSFSREPRAIPVYSDLSALHGLARWIGDLGTGIAGQKAWCAAVAARSGAKIPADIEGRAIRLAARLCLYSGGVEALGREVQRGLATLRTSPGRTGGGRPSGRKSKSEKTANELMKEKLESNRDARSWSLAQWAEAINRSKSTIAVTELWKSLDRLRAATKAERQYRAAEKRR